MANNGLVVMATVPCNRSKKYNNFLGSQPQHDDVTVRRSACRTKIKMTPSRKTNTRVSKKFNSFCKKWVFTGKIIIRYNYSGDYYFNNWYLPLLFIKMYNMIIYYYAPTSSSRLSQYYFPYIIPSCTHVILLHYNIGAHDV